LHAYSQSSLDRNNVLHLYTNSEIIMLAFTSLLQNTTVRIALGIVALMAAGSLTYYLIESAPPKVAFATATTGTVTEDVTATGVVSPIQNPTLSFEIGGRVSSVEAKVGEKVSTGTLLAILDTGVLSASLSAAQAKLNELEAGPRSVDIAGQKTSVTNAQQTLTNTYSNYPQTLLTTLSEAQSAVDSTNPLFNLSNKTDPALNVPSINPALGIKVDSDLTDLIKAFPVWQAGITAAGSNTTPAQLQPLTTDSLTNLNNVRTFLTDLIAALNNANVGAQNSQAQVNADIATANSALNTVNGLISSLNSTSQLVTTQQLAIQSAQDQLNVTLAGANSQDVDAQRAAVAGIEAQIRQQEIIAPFNGTVASVSIKSGDAAMANTAAISLIPNGTFEVPIYLAENDVAKVTVGEATDVTLDAYGTSRIFPATVASVETSPSIDPNSNGGTQGGYKITLIFTNADPAIANGMHANAVIHAGSAQNALLVPKNAVITDGTSSYVLKESGKTVVKTMVTTGLSDTTNIQILSGLSEGDQVSSVGAQ
jgi:HlyD family secretion protein